MIWLVVIAAGLAGAFLLGKRLTHRHPDPKPGADRHWADPGLGGPVPKDHPPTVVRQPDIPPHISLLLGIGRPPHIAGFVTTVVSNAIQRMERRWSRANLAVKRREVMAPLVADGDATTAVSPVRGVCGVMTAPIHVDPRGVFGGLCQPVRSLHAAARFLARQVRVADDLDGAAVTSALKGAMWSTLRGIPNYGEGAESRASIIACCCLGGEAASPGASSRRGGASLVYRPLSHRVPPQQDMVVRAGRASTRSIGSPSILLPSQAW